MLTKEQVIMLIIVNGWKKASIELNKDTTCQKRGIKLSKGTNGYISLNESWKLSENTFGAILNLIEDGKYVEEKVELKREDFTPLFPF